MGYKDFREFLDHLDSRGLLVRIKTPINKDTELMPLVRCQFRGLAPEKRRAFLFESVVGADGRKYGSKVAVGVLGASKEIYAAAMGCAVDEIHKVWERANLRPIEPKLVSDGPVKEEIHKGEEVEELGLEEFPIPISTPGFDVAPYLTSPYVVTKDPETGITNVGTYRAMIKGKAKTGVMTHQAQHIGIHLAKSRSLGRPLEAAIVLGSVPAVGMCSVAKIPYGINEYAVAGGIAGEPIELLKCETVDLEVPATAEIVLEGEIPSDVLEAEAPFGEYTGYMGDRAYNHVFNIKCITHRKNPIYQAFISQCPPSESSMIRKISYDAVLYKFLKYDCNIPSVLKVAMHESTGSWGYMVIQIKKTNPSQPWQALNAAVGFDATIGKIIVAVDEDIDPDDPDSVNWALSFRMQPHLDCRVTMGKSSMLDPSSAPPGSSTDEQRFPKPAGTSALLIDATRKHDYPPVSLPAKEYMQRALEIWRREKLPELKLKTPWHGYNLGNWSAELAGEASIAVEGRYLETGEKLEKTQRKLDW